MLLWLPHKNAIHEGLEIFCLLIVGHFGDNIILTIPYRVSAFVLVRNDNRLLLVLDKESLCIGE